MISYIRKKAKSNVCGISYLAFVLVIAIEAAAGGAPESQSRQSYPDSSAPMTLRQAVESAVESNSELKASREKIMIKDSNLKQAGLLPNPHFRYEMEDFGGNRELSGLRSTGTTAAISQQIELGGKRGKRRKLAGFEKSIAEHEYNAKVLDLVAGVRMAFYTLLAAQQAGDLAKEKVRLAHQVYNTVLGRVQAGKVSPVELNRSEVMLSASDIETRQAEMELVAARQALATLLGTGTAEFERAEGDIEQLVEPEELPELLARIDHNPDLAIWEEQISKRTAEADLARTGRIPDIEVSGGVKSYGESGNRAFVVELGIPIPLFDRNQGNVAAAEHGIARTNLLGDHARTRLIEALTRAHSELSSAFFESASLRDKVVKGAGHVFEAVQIGYAQGKFGYLELLDAQRTLFEARGNYLKALARYHKSRAAVDRLVGRSYGHLGAED